MLLGDGRRAAHGERALTTGAKLVDQLLHWLLPQPAFEPDPVGPVDVRQHALERGKAELRPQLPARGLLAETRDDVEELAITPPVIVPAAPDQLELHGGLPSRGRRRSRLPAPSVPRR